MGKIAEWLTEDGLLRIEGWARDGLTDKQIAHNMGIAYSTFRVWKQNTPAFSALLKKTKEVVDREVENALYKKAMGYTVQLRKTFKCKSVEYDENGRRVEAERLVVGFDEIHVPADTTAQMFWLKNRKPEQWRERKETASSQDNSETGVILMPEVAADG